MCISTPTRSKPLTNRGKGAKITDNEECRVQRDSQGLASMLSATRLHIPCFRSRSFEYYRLEANGSYSDTNSSKVLCC